MKNAFRNTIGKARIGWENYFDKIRERHEAILSAMGLKDRVGNLKTEEQI